MSTACHFRHLLGHKISESTIQSIKKAYKEQLHESRQAGRAIEVKSLPKKKLGRPVLLGARLDSQIQLYLRNVRAGGGPVTARISMAAARGIMLSSDIGRSKLAEYGGHIKLGRQWAYSLLECMNFVRRKATTAKSKYTIDDYKQVKKSFLIEIITIIQMEEIPPEFVLNLDQISIKIVPSSSWTMDKEGSKRVEVIDVGDKRMITAVFCDGLVGDFLPVQIIHRQDQSLSSPLSVFSRLASYHSDNHWSTEVTMIQYIEEIIVLYVNAVRDFLNDNKAAVVIMDNFKGQTTNNVLSLLEANDIHVCLLPSNTIDRLQPMDLSVNKPAKSFLKTKFEESYALQLAEQLKENSIDELEPIDLGLPILKELGAGWLVEMGTYISQNPQLIVNKLVKAGISAALDETKESDRTKESNRTEESDEDGTEESSGTETYSTFDSESECENCEPEDGLELLENKNMDSVIIIN